MAPASSVPIKEPLGPGPFSMDDFETGVTLGTGSFGRVRIATHKTTQTPWAIKILKKIEIIRMQQVRTNKGKVNRQACVLEKEYESSFERREARLVSLRSTILEMVKVFQAAVGET